MRIVQLSSSLALATLPCSYGSATDIPCLIKENQRGVAPSSIYEVSVESGTTSEVFYRIKLDAVYQNKPISEVFITKMHGANLLLIAPLAISEETSTIVETYFLASVSEVGSDLSLTIVYAERGGDCPDADAKILILQLPPDSAQHRP